MTEVEQALLKRLKEGKNLKITKEERKILEANTEVQFSEKEVLAIVNANPDVFKYYHDL